MAKAGDLINQDNLDLWVVSDQILITRSGKTAHTDYFYICAPSFMVSIVRNSSKDAIDIRNVARYTGSRWEYYTSDGTWSTTEPSSTVIFMNVPTGNTGPYFWGHNSDISKQTISSYRKSTEGKYYLWRFGVYCKEYTSDQVAKFWAGPIGRATSNWYNDNIRYKLLQSCGGNALTPHSWNAVNSGNQTAKYLWHNGTDHDYSKNDNGAVTYFGIGTDAGDLITTNNLGKLCNRG